MFRSLKALGAYPESKIVRLFDYDLCRLSRKGVADVIETINTLQKIDADLVTRNEGLSFDRQMPLGWCKAKARLIK